MIPFSWDQRISRAERLVSEYPASAEMLRFYAEVARFQKDVYEKLKADAETRLQPASVRADFRPFLALIQSIGPRPISEEAQKMARSNASFEDVLDAWNSTDQGEDGAAQTAFFARALLQPLAERLATRNSIPARAGRSCCPFCGEKPQAGVLRGEGDGGKRSLMCSLCSSEWEFRRLVCPACGEERNDRLPVYTAAEFAHVRVEACDTCHSYIKSVDLTKNGLAVPCVDEIATVSLDIRAEENGYRKIRRNLLGL
jgi:FdhE protein